MKVYFDYSGRGVEDKGEIYKNIYNILVKMDYKHLRPLTTQEYRDKLYSSKHEEKIKHYQDTLSFIKKSDIVVLEVSEHSLSMGFIMQKALELSKPVIALHLKHHEPTFALGIGDDKLQVVEYDPQEIESALTFAIDYAQEHQDTRFNFFISPKHQNYLDWVSRVKKQPRSVYLRNLIEDDMAKNLEYAGT